MIRAQAVSGGAIESPFGAAHRVNLDTPPLKGYWQGTLVPCCELPHSLDLMELAFLVRNRH